MPALSHKVWRTFRLLSTPAFLWVLLGCDARLWVPAGSFAPVLRIQAPSPIPTYTCAPLTVTSTNPDGTPYPVLADTAVFLSGLGSGNTYPTNADCVSEHANSVVFLLAGTASTSFYYRTSTAESLTLTARADRFTAGTQAATTVLFNVLGQPSGTSLVQLQQSMNDPYGMYSDGTRFFMVDADNNRVLIWNSVPTSGNQPPDLVLGQPDFFSTAANNGNASCSASSMFSPSEVYSDGTTLYITDSGNHRVLIWTSPITTNGQAANLVLGQADFISSDPNRGGSPTANTLSSPSGITSDGTSLFVAEGGNNRVLIWTLPISSNGQPALYALGQADTSSGSANRGGSPAGNTLSAPRGVFTDGTRLFVSEKNNNRVLEWTLPITGSGQAASFALGQQSGVNNLTSGTANWDGVAGDSMSQPSYLCSDGTRLYIVDSGDHRVMVWSSIPSSAVSADFALGQPDLASDIPNNGGISASTMAFPRGIFCGTSQLFVADSSNNRVLAWNSHPTSSGARAADFVIGQPSFTAKLSNNYGVSDSLMGGPGGVFSDGTHLFVADSANHRVLVWNSLPTTNGQSPNVVLGQPDFSSNAANNGGLSASSLNNPTSVYSDGTNLYVADTGNHRILVWAGIPTTNQQPAAFALGQPDTVSGTANNGGLSAATLNTPSAVSGDVHHLYATDTLNNRTLVWNLPLTGASGQAAVAALGQADLVSNTANSPSLSAATMNGPAGVFSDGATLLVADTANHRVLMWTSSLTGSGQAANVVLGQPSSTSNTANNGGISAATLNSPAMVFKDGTRVFVADTGNNRILAWNGIPSSGRAADLVFGQPNFTSSTANNGGFSASSLNTPNGIFSDGVRLLAADTGNYRILILPLP